MTSWYSGHPTDHGAPAVVSVATGVTGPTTEPCTGIDVPSGITSAAMTAPVDLAANAATTFCFRAQTYRGSTRRRCTTSEATSG